jgi:hypothetical protein
MMQREKIQYSECKVQFYRFQEREQEKSATCQREEKEFYHVKISDKEIAKLQYGVKINKCVRSNNESR